MKNAIALLCLILVISCQQKETISKQNSDNLVKSQIESWKKELLINGEVGKPCQDDIEKWAAENPERYFGLPNDSIKSKSFDVNNDKIKDVLLYFPAGDCCSCAIGINEASDYLKLIYSNGNEFLTNDNLREKIALKIESEYFAKTNNDVERAIFSVTDFNKDISGTYKLWALEDPDCCASVEGTFNYNPFTFKIQITYRNVK